MYKTYGIFGMSEYITDVTLGDRHLPIHFEGGLTNGRGVVPATFRTNNPVVQYALERSPIYLSKRAVLLRSDPEESDKKTSAPKGEAAASAASEEAKEEAQAEDNGQTVVEVTCVQDAQAYLVQHFDIPAYKAASRAAAIAAGAERGVTFKFV